MSTHISADIINPSPEDGGGFHAFVARWRRHGALFTAGLFVLAACGGSGDSERADVAVADPATDTTVAAPTTAVGAVESAPPAVETTSPPAEPTTSVPADTTPVDFVVTCQPGSGGSFAGQDFPARSFDDENLRCADFTGAELSQPSMERVDASGALFVGTSFSQANISNFTAIGADFSGASFAQGRIIDSDLSGAIFDDTSFAQTGFENTICPDGRNSDDIGGTCRASGAPLTVDFDASATATVDTGTDADTDTDTDGDAAPVDDGTASVTPSAPVALSSCTGFAFGRYEGGDSGPIAARLDADGTLSTVFVSPFTLDIDVNDLSDLGDLGLVIGEDITISASGVTIEPGAIRIDASGVRLGNVELDLVEVGSVDADGNIVAIATTGALVTGTYDFTNCTASGTWINVGIDGTWQVGPSATVVSFGDGECDGGVFVGVGGEGVSVDLDAGCRSARVAQLPAATDAAIDGVAVAADDSLVAYTLSDEVLFELESFEVTAAARDRLAAVADDISRRGGASVEIVGHTDALGSDAYNVDLSIARADAVAQVLDELLVETTLDITTSGLGESRPAEPNQNADGSDNPAGRAANRRVEILVTL